MVDIDVSSLYKLPWEKKDNPNGWLELTTFCQLKCPGCYRGLDKLSPKRFHSDLNEMKNQVDFMKTIRNVQTISLSGGEPLLYPNLEELVEYIHSKNLRIKIYTNGIILTRERLIRLKNLGVSEFIIHIDKSQNRKGYSSEKDLNVLREKFCELFRSVGNINLGFILPISKDNFGEIEEVLEFYKRNADIINLVVFTCFNDAVNKNNPHKKKIGLEIIYEKIKKAYSCNPSSYLPKILDKSKPAWLFFYPLISNGEVIGRVTPNEYKFLQNRYRKKNGRYFITIVGNKVKPKNFFYFFNLLQVIKLLFFRKNVYSQVILIIDSPQKIHGKWDLCDGCPDPVLYKNRLVPSCLLERVKNGEDITI